VTRLEELGVPPYDELVIVANRDRLQDEPDYADAVRSFLTAMVEGIEAAPVDQRRAVEIMRAHTEYTPEELDGMVPQTLALLRPPSGRQTGCFDLRGWETFGRWMHGSALLERPVDATLVATNDYLPACG
jgi:putative hydroxymethylpyrimidine transport system substrate-binding protein